MSDKVGVFNRLQYAATGTTGTAEFEFLEGSQLGLSEQFIDTNGLRGTASHVADRVRQGTRRADATLLFAPTPAELNTLLYLALGGTKTGTTIPLAETLPTAEWFASRVGTVYHYTGCVVETLTITASEGGPL